MKLQPTYNSYLGLIETISPENFNERLEHYLYLSFESEKLPLPKYESIKILDTFFCDVFPSAYLSDIIEKSKTDNKETKFEIQFLLLNPLTYEAKKRVNSFDERRSAIGRLNRGLNKIKCALKGSKE